MTLGNFPSSLGLSFPFCKNGTNHSPYLSGLYRESSENMHIKPRMHRNHLANGATDPHGHIPAMPQGLSKAEKQVQVWWPPEWGKQSLGQECLSHSPMLGSLGAATPRNASSLCAGFRAPLPGPPGAVQGRGPPQPGRARPVTLGLSRASEDGTVLEVH